MWWRGAGGWVWKSECIQGAKCGSECRVLCAGVRVLGMHVERLSVRV